MEENQQTRDREYNVSLQSGIIGEDDVVENIEEIILSDFSQGELPEFKVCKCKCRCGCKVLESKAFSEGSLIELSEGGFSEYRVVNFPPKEKSIIYGSKISSYDAVKNWQ